MSIDKLAWSWDRYKEFFHITYLRYLVAWFSLVPLLATVLEKLDSSLILGEGDQKIQLTMAIPFSWELLWISSFFFFVAFGLYHGFCPRFIKRYNTYTDYLQVKHDARWIVYEVRPLLSNRAGREKLVSRLTTKKYLLEIGAHSGKDIEVEEEQTVLRFRHEDRWYKLAAPLNPASSQKSEDAQLGIYWEVFAVQTNSRPVVRILISVLLVISAALFGLVLMQHISTGIMFSTKYLCSSVLPRIAPSLPFFSLC